MNTPINCQTCQHFEFWPTCVNADIEHCLYHDLPAEPATPARFEMPADICGNMLAITNELRIEIATLKGQNAELKESNRRLREIINDAEIQNRAK